MMKKKFFVMSFFAVLSLGSATAMADGLSLQSGLDTPVKVVCNGTALPYELNSNSPVNDIPWWMVSAAFSSQSVLNCQFMLDNQASDPVGSATLTLNVLAGTAEATNLHYLPAYKVSVTPGVGSYEQSMTVLIQKSA